MDSLGLNLAASNVKSYLWSFPGCPVRIHISLDLMERIRREILALAPEGREVGGLLLGSTFPQTADVQVLDYFLIAPPALRDASAQTAEESQYLVCSDGLARALANCSATQRQVVGYFRTHLGPRIQLSPEELDCIRKNFRDAKNVFLVIRPHDGRASAGFFFWQDGSVFGDSTLTFPFSPADLAKPEWSSLVGGSPPQSRVENAVTRVRARLSSGANRVSLALFAVAVLFVVVIFAGRGLITSGRSSPQPAGALGLEARRDGLAVRVSWDASNPQLARAREANLLIWDGPGQPVFLALTPVELRSGHTVVTSVGDRVAIRMDVVGESGEAKIESIALSGENAALSGSIPASVSSAEPIAKEPPAKTKAATPPGSPAPKRWKILKDLSEPGAARDPSPAPAFHALRNEQDPLSHAAIQEAAPITETQPTLPADLRARIDRDNVIDVRVEIDAAGRVVSAKSASEKGPLGEILAGYAVRAALSWRFRPATQNGKPVRSEKTIDFLFRSSTN